MTDPFPPKDPQYSMDKPELLPAIKYPKFSKLDRDQKMEILTDEMLMHNPTEGVEVMLRDCGISHEQYKEIIADKEYVKLLRDKATREKFAPYIPRIFEQLGIGAANGDDSKLRSALQTIGSMSPENATFVNQQFVNMSDEQLALETEKLLKELRDE